MDCSVSTKTLGVDSPPAARLSCYHISWLTPAAGRVNPQGFECLTCLLPNPELKSTYSGKYGLNPGNDPPCTALDPFPCETLHRHPHSGEGGHTPCLPKDRPIYEQSTPTRRADTHTTRTHLPCIVPQVIEGERHICNAAEENGLAVVLCSSNSSSSV